MTYELIITIVNRGFSQLAMDAARRAGATGGTILHARGAGAHEAQSFYNITVHPEKEVVLLLVSDDVKCPVMQSLLEGAGPNTQARGLIFSLPVDDVMGLSMWHSSDE